MSLEQLKANITLLKTLLKVMPKDQKLIFANFLMNFAKEILEECKK